MYAWQFAKAQQVVKEHSWAQFVTMQDMYNLINREEEREMIPLCADQKVARIVWSPQAKGRLARKLGTVTKRYDHEEAGKRFFPLEDENNLEIIHHVEKVAEKKELRWDRRHWRGFCSNRPLRLRSSVLPRSTIWKKPAAVWMSN